MNTQNQTAKDQKQDQKKSAFDEGLMDNSNNQSQTPKMSADEPLDKNPDDRSNPEIDIPFNKPEKTEKKIPDMKGEQR